MNERRPVHRDRGALSNPTSRFERYARAAFDDGWGTSDDEPPKLATEVRYEKTLRIINDNDSPDIPFSKSINPYKGCEHGCSYCYARPTHAYLGMSPGLDFESKIVAKPEAPARLREALGKKSYRCETIVIGANTDPYQRLERTERITRGLLEVLAEHQHPVSIITKSNLILRDLDLLSAMAERRLAHVAISVTTLDRKLARIMEPRAAAPQRRVEAIRALADSGVPTTVMAAPMIPAINDTELERILEAARDAGARGAGTVLLRLPLELKELFEKWLRHHFPERAERVLSLIRDTRGGELYVPEFGVRMRGTGAWADMLGRRFGAAVKRLGFDDEPAELDTTRFVRPGQLALF